MLASPSPPPSFITCLFTDIKVHFNVSFTQVNKDIYHLIFPAFVLVWNRLSIEPTAAERSDSAACFLSNANLKLGVDGTREKKMKYGKEFTLDATFLQLRVLCRIVWTVTVVQCGFLS